MKKIRRWISSLRNQVKFAIYNPQNFNEIFGFTTSKINILSLVFLAILFVSFLWVLLLSWTPLGKSFFSEGSADKTELIEQRIRLDSLKNKVEAQDRYVIDLKKMLFGEFEEDSVSYQEKELAVDVSKIKTNATKSELKVEENVKVDQFTNSAKKDVDLVHFMAPVKGVLSQKYSFKEHQAVDIVTPENAYFSACLSGTVIYSDYSNKDGYVLIIEHANDFLSIYKHAKTLFKTRGERVQVGDIIGVVGSTGTHASGAHLHFELWMNQQAVNPLNYMKFE